MSLSFPYPWIEGDAESFLEWSNSMVDRRELAFEKPFTPGFEFPWVPPPACLDVKSDKNRRMLPSFLKSKRVLDSGSVKIRLLEALQNDPEYMSQVWLAKVVDFEDKVIVKIIQPSMIWFPGPDFNLWYIGMSDYRVPEELFARESLAYEWLAHLQGAGIPYLFGTHEVCLALSIIIARH